MPTPTLEIGKVDLRRMAVEGNAVLGIRNSGKTVTAKLLAHGMHAAGIPFIAYDPIGMWRWLRVPGRGNGIPIVVAGGQNPDLPLTVDNCTTIVEAAMREGVSLVLDLYDINLSKADWRRIVAQTVRLLLHENNRYGLRHVFLEEAAEFCPQQVRDGVVYAEIEKLARMGGNAKVGITLINQRAQEVNKAVLDLCDNLFIHRQRGRHAIESLSKWFDFLDKDMAKEITASLPSLPTGHCWTWFAGQDAARLVKVPMIPSHHPDRNEHGGVELEKSPIMPGGITEFIDGMLKKLETEEERAARTMQLEDAAEESDSVEYHYDHAAVEQQARAEGYEQGRATMHSEIRQTATMRLDDIENALATIEVEVRGLRNMLTESEGAADPVERAPPASAPGDAFFPPPSAPPRDRAPASMPSGMAKLLSAIAQHGRASREQLTILTGYKQTTRNEYIKQLKAAGYITIASDGDLLPTKRGTEALGSQFRPLPKGRALREHWSGNLPHGEKVIFEIITRAYPKAVARDEISKQTNYKQTTRNEYIKKLVARRLVANGDGGVKASSHLF